MGHADDSFDTMLVRGTFEYFVECRNCAFQTLETETLLADEAGLQKKLKLLCLNQAVENTVAVAVVKLPGVRSCFHAVLKPLLLAGVLDVHVLDTNGAAISGAKSIDDFAQGLVRLHVRGNCSAGGFHRAGEERTIKIPNREAVGRRIELGMVSRIVPQRVRVGK